MPRLLRYFLVWLSCTAVTVTAVFLTVRFVVHSTAPLPPTAHGMPTAFGAPTVGTGTMAPKPSPVSSAPSTPTHRPSPTAPATTRPAPTRTASPAPTTSKPPAGGQGYDCSGGVGAHAVQAQGGQVTVRWGDDAVCLVSAVPAQGFTTNTAQDSARSLVVTFSGAHHRSQITATLDPQAKAVTTETSW
ncbi:MAG: hypothetical protein FWE75_22885 [Actinomycetia bacterium]|nr:hypothetical protein [Actinomycetes bacterium]